MFGFYVGIVQISDYTLLYCKTYTETVVAVTAAIGGAAEVEHPCIGSEMVETST